MKNSIYTLPQDTFVAGQTRKYAWKFYRKSGQPHTANDCVGTFALIDYSEKDGEPILVKDIEFATEDEGMSNVGFTTLEPNDTINLDGKYVYQLTIKDPEGNVDIPDKGIIYISNNIHKDFIV